MEPTMVARPQGSGHAPQSLRGQVIRFPTRGKVRRAWPGLEALLPLSWRRCVVIYGRRYWRPA